MFKIAMVKDVNLWPLSIGMVEIHFVEHSQAEFERMGGGKGPYLMVESMAFYEAYSHVLRGMKNLSQESFPMQQYIVKSVATQLSNNIIIGHMSNSFINAMGCYSFEENVT